MVALCLKTGLNLDHELEELEKTMGSKFEYEENPPLRAEFRDDAPETAGKIKRNRISAVDPEIDRRENRLPIIKNRFLVGSWKKTFSLRPGYLIKNGGPGSASPWLSSILTAGIWGMGGMGLFVKSAPGHPRSALWP
jgi:hypothetical protein